MTARTRVRQEKVRQESVQVPFKTLWLNTPSPYTFSWSGETWTSLKKFKVQIEVHWTWRQPSKHWLYTFLWEHTFKWQRCHLSPFHPRQQLHCLQSMDLMWPLALLFKRHHEKQTWNTTYRWSMIENTGRALNPALFDAFSCCCTHASKHSIPCDRCNKKMS